MACRYKGVAVASEIVRSAIYGIYLIPNMPFNVYSSILPILIRIIGLFIWSCIFNSDYLHVR